MALKARPRKWPKVYAELNYYKTKALITSAFYFLSQKKKSLLAPEC